MFAFLITKRLAAFSGCTGRGGARDCREDTQFYSLVQQCTESEEEESEHNSRRVEESFGTQLLEDIEIAAPGLKSHQESQSPKAYTQRERLG